MDPSDPAGTMDGMSLLQRHPGLRWVAPLTAIAVLAGGVAWQNRATAAPGLEPRSAEQLLTDLASAKPVALSGTVQQQVNLGLPSLPKVSPHGGTNNPLELLNGTKTWRVWTNAKDSQRVALIDGSDEVNLISNPQQTWLWNSATREAVKFDKPTTASPSPTPTTPTPTPTITPNEAAKKVLEAIEPTTTVSTGSTTTVAGRDAYQLVLVPTTKGTTVGRITIAVDGQTKLPLQVRVFATGTNTASIDIGFTQLRLGSPEASVFQFVPPKGAKVLTPEQYRQQQVPTGQPTPTPTKTGPDKKPAPSKKPASQPSAKTVGSSWTQVRVVTNVTLPDDPITTQLLAQLTPVKGAWGTGKLWRGTLVSAVITDDGRVAVGAVEPSLLYAALG